MTQTNASILKPRIGTYLAFFVAGLVQAMWAPLIPYLQGRLQASDAELGVLLLCLGFGSIIAMPLTGTLAARSGAKPVMLVGGFLMACMLPLLASVTSVWAAALALLVFGASLGSLDVAMNIHAVEVQALSPKPLMSGFHAQFSLGGFAGAGAMTLLLSLGMAPLPAAAIGSALALVILFSSGPLLIARKGAPGESGVAIPRGVVIVLALMAFAMFLAEGAVLDWSAVFMVRQELSPESQAGIGYMAFSIAMTVGRLTGDWIVARLGYWTTLIGGAIVAAAGYGIVILSPVTWSAIAGFALVGLGAANVVPVLISLTGKQKAMPPGLAVAAVTSVGYAGILLGPALLGFVANSVGLVVSFVLLVAVCLSVSVMAVVAKKNL